MLSGLVPVRCRPGKPIGSTSSLRLHHLVWEIIANGIAVPLAGFATRIVLVLNPDNSEPVLEAGRGIPVDIQAKTGRPALATV